MIGRTIVEKMNPIVVELKKRSVSDTDLFINHYNLRAFS